ncbi:MAG: septal ring lytic transglycosylase RlpA family protein [Betaproteobacteria bacterium]
MIKRLLPLGCCLLLISACATKKQDAVQPLDYSRQKLKASQRPYTVYGRRYEPLQSHEGFSQTGVASWYGKDFHGKTTSSGERYDMNAMTAAHKTLPLGVFVKVKNTDNGREAVVRVNDRGPFVKGRVLDLSYAAAKKLGVDIAGTAAVRIEALGYRGSGAETYTAVDSYDAGNYTVQVGAFKEYGNAQRLFEDMKRRYGFSEIRTTEINGDTFYRVYAGKYTSLRAADQAEQEFSAHGYPGSFTVALE